MENNNSNIKNNNFINKGIIPLVTYINADINKSNIFKENIRKSGVYIWVNKINGKSYVGYSTYLTDRFSNYYSLSSLKSKGIHYYTSCTIKIWSF